MGGQKYESLVEQAEELRRVLPTKPNLSKTLVKLAQDFTRPANELTDALLTEWYAELDAWTIEVAEFCTGFNSQLDLTGSLPQTIVKPLQFQKISQSATTL